MAYDMGGLPLFDDNRNLWIKLTICGVTRLGVGDGKSPKECIGDAIRNAAMRFGVALDLWAKEDLHAMDQGRTEPAPPAATRTMSRRGVVADSPAPVEPSAPDVAMSAPDADGITDKQRARLHILVGQLGITREQKIAGLVSIIKRPIKSSNELTEAEADAAIMSLTKKVNALRAAQDEPS